MAVMLECDVLREAREKLGLTAGQIANKANVALRQYQRFESGERNLSASSFAIARRVLEALEIDLTSFGKGSDGVSDEPIIEYTEQIASAYVSSCEVFRDKICVFIGRLERCSKQEAQDRVYAVGGIPQNGVAAFVSFVIAGKVSESSKAYKAARRYESHGLLTILSEQEFFDALDGRYIPSGSSHEPRDGGYDPNIPALLNQKRAAYLASKKIIGAAGNLLDARSVVAMQSFVQHYMYTTLADQVRGHYKRIIDDLEEGAELLLDMSGFFEMQKDGNGFCTGYNKSLTSGQSKAVVYAESFLASIDDCKCPAKLRKRRNSTSNEHRADESQWMRAAAAEIKRKLNEDHDDDFWCDRNPVFLYLDRKGKIDTNAGGA